MRTCSQSRRSSKSRVGSKSSRGMRCRQYKAEYLHLPWPCLRQRGRDHRASSIPVGNRLRESSRTSATRCVEEYAVLCRKLFNYMSSVEKEHDPRDDLCIPYPSSLNPLSLISHAVRRAVPEARSHPPDQAAGSPRQFIVKGFLHGLHASPFHGFSVEFSEHRKYTPGDDPEGYRLADLRQDRQVLRQEIRGRDQHHRLHDDGPQPLDGLHLPAGVDQVRVLDLPGGRALLLDDPPAGPGGPDHVRHARSATA